MKKETVYKVFLIALPVLAILFGCGSESITIRDRATDVITHQSYFALIPESAFPFATILSMLCSVVALVLAVAYGITGKETCLRGIYIVMFAAVFSAEIPGFLDNSRLVLASIPVSVLLIGECAMAYFKLKKSQEKPKPAQRLRVRR